MVDQYALLCYASLSANKYRRGALMKFINWAEFAKLKNVFLRLAILNCEGEERKLLEKGIPELFVKRRQPMPISVIFWLVDQWEDQSSPLYIDCWYCEDLTKYAKLHVCVLDDSTDAKDAIKPTEAEWKDLLRHEDATLRDRTISICVFRGKIYLIVFVSGDYPHGAYLIPIKSVDLNT